MHQGRSSVMLCLHCRFRVFLHHIGSDSNPGMTLEEPSRLPHCDVLRTCLYQKNKKPNFGRSIDICHSVTANEKQGIPQSSTIHNTIFTSSGFGWLLPAPVQIILATDWFRTGALQVLGSALAGRVVGARIWPSVSRCLGISFGLRGPFPPDFTPFGKVGLIARRLRCP